MKRAAISAGTFVGVLVLVVLAANRAIEQDLDARGVGSLVAAASSAATEADQGFLYGRVTSEGGTIYEGRLRFGGDEEAFWGDYFNGFKDENPWAAYAPQLKAKRPFQILWFEFSVGEGEIDLGRPLMVRFGDIARIEARGRDLQVTFKSGTVAHLDRFAADDFADGVRVWDSRRGVVDLDEWQVRSIDLLPTASLATAPARLHGTVRTEHGDFTGFIEWNRKGSVGGDELVGHTSDGERRLRFDTIRSIARVSRDRSLITLRDGREVVISITRDRDPRGIYVDDGRYGRVLVSWEAFASIDFSAARSGPAYNDFPPGNPITGTVITRDGRRLAGRLVYDLDESETTETLDAPSHGVNFTIPFGLVASIAPTDPGQPGGERARVTLHDGEVLPLERAGDLGDGNAGMLVFVNGRERPEYVEWIDVEQVDLDRPIRMYPPPRR